MYPCHVSRLPLLPIAVLLDLEQVAGELEEFFTLLWLLGICMEGSLAAVAQIGTSLTLNRGINGSEDNSARATFGCLEKQLLHERHRCGGGMFKQIRVHYARMHHIHLDVRLLRIQHTLQVAGEENLRQL